MSALRTFRLVGFLEGLSFLVLLLVAMPMKYLLGLPLATRVVGSVHGLLFLLFLGALFRVALEHSWPLRRSLLAFGAAFVPCGPFLLDRSLRQDLGQ